MMNGFQVWMSVSVRPGYSDMNVPQLDSTGIWSHLSQVGNAGIEARGFTGGRTATPAGERAGGSGMEGPDTAVQNWEVLVVE